MKTTSLSLKHLDEHKHKNFQALMPATDKTWDIIIEPRGSLFKLNLKELWRYRDLLEMYIKRDIVTFYKQTILGPIWFFIQPVFTTIVYMFVFGGLAGIPTDGIPQPLFYLSGICLWNYFSESLNQNIRYFSFKSGNFWQSLFSKNDSSVCQ